MVNRPKTLCDLGLLCFFTACIWHSCTETIIKLIVIAYFDAACGFQVNENGLISFGSAIHRQYVPRSLPISSPSTPFIAPFWADVDTTRNNGRIYYRSVTSGTFVQMLRSHFYSFIIRHRRCRTFSSVGYSVYIQLYCIGPMLGLYESSFYQSSVYC